MKFKYISLIEYSKRGVLSSILLVFFDHQTISCYKPEKNNINLIKDTSGRNTLNLIETIFWSKPCKHRTAHKKLELRRRRVKFGTSANNSF